jgi:hypothetical protein
MAIAAACGAAGKLAVPIASDEGATNSHGNGARPASHVEWRAVGVMAHDHQRGIAGQTLGRFRGNADWAVIQFHDRLTVIPRL